MSAAAKRSTMKVISLLYTTLLVLVAQPCQGNDALLCSEFQNGAEEENCDQEHRNLQGANVGLLNSLIRLLIPPINNAIANLVPDPLVLDLGGIWDLGSIDFGCGDVGLSFTYNLGGLIGLSTFFIDTLEVIPGTENVEGCINSAWSGTFNMSIASATTFIVDDLGAGFQAIACDVPFSESVGGDIITTEPALGGLVDLAGNLCAGVLSIDTASILDTLQVGYSSVATELQDVPDILTPFVTQVEGLLDTLLQSDLVDTMEPTIRPIIEQQMAEATLFAPAQLLPISAAIATNNVRSIVESSASFLGGLGGGGSN